MTGPAARTSMLVTPAKQVIQGNGAVTVHVIDLGSLPLRVTTSSVLLHAKCAQSGTSNITAKPASFTLQPGHGKAVTLTVHGLAGDYGIAFAGAPVTGHHGGITALDSIGSQVVTGNATACTAPHIKALPAASSSGFPVVPLVIALAVLVALIAAVAVTVRRRRHRVF